MSDKKPIKHGALRSWVALNEYLMEDSTTEANVNSLLKLELDGRKRKIFVERLHSRLNKLRADRERGDLAARLL